MASLRHRWATWERSSPPRRRHTGLSEDRRAGLALHGINSGQGVQNPTAMGSLRAGDRVWVWEAESWAEANVVAHMDGGRLRVRGQGGREMTAKADQVCAKPGQCHQPSLLFQHPDTL